MDTYTLWRKIQRGDPRLKFAGVYPANRLPLFRMGRPVGLVANLDPAHQPGTHWVAIVLLPGGRGEYFDSFGFPPLSHFLETYMNRECPEGWIFNTVPLQSPRSSVCAHFCITFLSLRLRGLSMSAIVDLFDRRDFRKNDQKVTEYVAALYPGHR